MANCLDWYQNNLLAKERKKEYASYAEDNWNFASWVHDYYKWYLPIPDEEFVGDEVKWNNPKIGIEWPIDNPILNWRDK